MDYGELENSLAKNKMRLDWTTL